MISFEKEEKNTGFNCMDIGFYFLKTNHILQQLLMPMMDLG